MFRTLELRSDGSSHVESGLALVSPPPAGTLRWIDLTDPTDALLALLGDRFGFHPVALESCTHTGLLPHADAYEDYLFVVTCGFALSADDVATVRLLEAHAFVGRAYLVTVHLRDIPALEAVWRRAEREPALLRGGPDLMYHHLTQSFAVESARAAEQLAEQLDAVDDVMAPSTHGEVHGAVTALKRQLAEMRKVLSPQRDCMADLVRQDRWLSQQTRFHLRDVHNHLASVLADLDVYRELLGGSGGADDRVRRRPLRDLFGALAIVSAGLLPMAVVTRALLRNLKPVDSLSSAIPWVVLASSSAIQLVAMLWVRRRRWT